MKIQTYPCNILNHFQFMLYFRSSQVFPLLKTMKLFERPFLQSVPTAKKRVALFERLPWADLQRK